MRWTSYPRTKANSKFAGYDEKPFGFSAADITAVIPPNPQIGLDVSVPLGTLSMLTVSTKRDKFPVASLGRIAPKGFTAGHLIVAGSMAFSTIDRAAFSRILAGTRTTIANNRGRRTTDRLLADQLPLFDIIVTCVNEAGVASYMSVEGVTITDGGVVISMDSVIPSETYGYMATNLIPLQPFTEYNNDMTQQPLDNETNETNPLDPYNLADGTVGNDQFTRDFSFIK